MGEGDGGPVRAGGQGRASSKILSDQPTQSRNRGGSHPNGTGSEEVRGTEETGSRFSVQARALRDGEGTHPRILHQDRGSRSLKVRQWFHVMVVCFSLSVSN